MPRRNRKAAQPVKITNPAASRLPRQRGTFAPGPPTPAPITREQIREDEQMRPSSSVVYTSKKASDQR